MNIFWLSWVLGILSVFGMWKLGSYKLWAWVYLGILEVLWAAYGFFTGQYGFILIAIGYVTIYMLNYKRWKQE